MNISAYFTSKQILPFGFAENRLTEDNVIQLRGRWGFFEPLPPVFLSQAVLDCMLRTPSRHKTLIQCCDAGPTFYQHWFHVFCLLRRPPVTLTLAGDLRVQENEILGLDTREQNGDAGLNILILRMFYPASPFCQTAVTSLTYLKVKQRLVSELLRLMEWGKLAEQ